MVSASVYFKLFLSIPCRTPTTPPRAFCRSVYEGSSTHARYDVMSLQTSCSDLGGVRSSRHPGALRSWPPHILEVCGVRPILEVCGVRLTPVVCGVGFPRSWSSDDRVIVSVPWPVAWLLYQLSRLPLLDARAACGARVVRTKIGFRV